MSNRAFQIYAFGQKYSDFSLNSVAKGLLGEKKIDYGVELGNLTLYQDLRIRHNVKMMLG